MAKLITIYAGFGDILLLQKPVESVSGSNVQPQHKYWLIDGGPLTLDANPNANTADIPYQQYLKFALKRFCASRLDPQRPYKIDLLEGIVVTHPDADHIQGITELIRTWLPDTYDAQVSEERPLFFHGPVVLNSIYFQDTYRGLCDLLGTKHFDVEKLDWDVLLDHLRHQSTDTLYRMQRKNIPSLTPLKPVISSISPRDPAIKQAAEYNNTIDISPTNVSSILTTWTDGSNQLKIVTSGDGIASNILSGMINVSKLDTVIEVFKVPHHGSEKNSQLGNLKSNADLEEKYHVFMVMSLFYLDKFKRLHNYEVLERVRNDILAELETTCKQTNDQREKSITPLKKYQEPQLHTLCYTIPNSSTKNDLDDMGNLEIAVFPLAQRYKDILNGSEVMDATSTIRYKTGAQWTIDKMKHDLQNEKIFQDVIDDASFIGKLRIAWRVKRFYDSFRANNYLISANGKHQHPSQVLLAGLIAAITNHHANDKGYKARTIVTDGSSVELTLVRHLLKTMLPETQPAQWAEAVSLHYLVNDYLVFASPDATMINSLGVIPLVDDGKTFPYLNKLKTEFNRALAINLPRTIDPHHSRFIITTTGNGPTYFLTIDKKSKLLYLKACDGSEKKPDLEQKQVLLSFHFQAPEERWTVANPWLNICLESVFEGVRVHSLTDRFVRFGEENQSFPQVPCHLYQRRSDGIYQLLYDQNPGKLNPPPILFSTGTVNPVNVTLTRV